MRLRSQPTNNYSDLVRDLLDDKKGRRIMENNYDDMHRPPAHVFKEGERVIARGKPATILGIMEDGEFEVEYDNHQIERVHKSFVKEMG